MIQCNICKELSREFTVKHVSKFKDGDGVPLMPITFHLCSWNCLGRFAQTMEESTADMLIMAAYGKFEEAESD